MRILGIDPATRRLTTEIPAGQKTAGKMVKITGKKKPKATETPKRSNSTELTAGI